MWDTIINIRYVQVDLNRRGMSGRIEGVGGGGGGGNKWRSG